MGEVTRSTFTSEPSCPMCGSQQIRKLYVKDEPIDWQHAYDEYLRMICSDCLYKWEMETKGDLIKSFKRAASENELIKEPE
jgi:hypothetical protein